MNPNPDDDRLPAVIRSRLRLKHFELFRQVCALGTIRKAAAAANMTQPAATKLIYELEDMFGVPLFERTRRGMQATAQGEILRRHVAIVLADIGHIAGELNHFASGGGGQIRLGILPSLSPLLLARSIDALLAQHPRAQLSVEEGTTDGLLQRLARNELDLCFGRLLQAARPEHLRVTRVYTEPFDIVCGSGHALARLSDPKWRELAREAWVLPALGTPLREIADSLFTSKGSLRPTVSVASSSFHQMRSVIAAGRLLGVLPHSIARAGEEAGDLVILRPRQAGKVAPISLILRSDVVQPPAVAAFERITLSVAQALRLDRAPRTRA